MMPAIFPDMRSRLVARELMDNAAADEKLLVRTLRQFKFINLLFSSGRRLINTRFFKRMQQAPGETYSMIDLGAGGGDLAIWAAKKARRRGLKLRIFAIDLDNRIAAFAARAAREYPEVTVLAADALDLSMTADADFIFSNHFLHHLDWTEIESVTRHAIQKARIAFLFNDLSRSWLSYMAYALFAKIFTRRSFALTDGLLSIRRGFTPDELKCFVASRFPEHPIRVIRAWPGRVILYYEKNRSLGA